MKARILILIATLAIMFNSCKSTPDLTEDEVYKIVNEIIADDTLSIHRVCWKFQNIQLTDEYSKEFTKLDIDFIEKQNYQFKNSRIKQNKLKWFWEYKKGYEFSAIDTICDIGIIYHISFPLISIDRKKVIIEIEEDCNCGLGGQGGTKLYQKENGHWKITKIFNYWISNHISKTKNYY
jgi:hypothetical protein